MKKLTIKALREMGFTVIKSKSSIYVEHDNYDLIFEYRPTFGEIYAKVSCRADREGRQALQAHVRQALGIDK